MSRLAAVGRWWRDGGGAPPGSPRARRNVAVLAVMASALAGAVAVVASGSSERSLAGRLAVAGVALVALAVARWPALTLAGLLAIGAAAVVPVAARSGTVLEDVVVAALLVATGELAGWADDLRSIVPAPKGESTLRAMATVLCAFGAGAVAAGVLVAGALDPPDGALAVVLGSSAVVVVLSFAALRRWSHP